MDQTHLQWIAEKQESLNSCLKSLISIELVDSEERFNKLKKASSEIIKIYEEKDGDLPFRHMYSLFHWFINDLSDEDLDVMMENLGAVLEMSRDSSQYPNMIKLYDHLKIEIPRKNQYNDIERENEKLRSKLEESQKTLANLKNELEESQKTLANLKEEYSNSSIRLVTVLGMFTAIVLAFTGGMGFLTGSLSGAENVDFFKLIFLILLCGLILYNLILLLLSVIEKATKISLLTSEKIYRRMIIIFNALLLLLMLLDGILYLCTQTS